MKKTLWFIYLLILLSLCSTVYSQSLDRNYVKTVVYLDSLENGTRDSIVSVQYYDGLGRPTQSVTGGMNTSGRYLHSFMEYDACGRESRVWTAVPGAQMPDYLNPENLISTSLSTYNDSRGYSDIVYDALDRTTFVSTPGEAWQGKGKATRFRTNRVGEVRHITPSTLADVSSFYNPGTLYGTESTDEDGIRMVTFKDLFGQTVLERRYLATDSLDTYYIYNDLRQLAWVLPPKYNQHPSLDSLSVLAFQYEYNHRGRVSMKKLPGCDPVHYWYDQADRMIKMQDGELYDAGRYRSYTYDKLSRVLRQSICLSSDSTKEYDEIINIYDYDTSIRKILLNFPDSILVIGRNRSHGIGKLTGCRQRTSNGDYILQSFAYDDKGRMSRKSEVGLNGILTETNYTYNFVGDVTKEKTIVLRKENRIFIPILETEICNSYAPHSRLLEASTMYLTEIENGQRIHTDTIALQNLTYDDLGHVVSNARSGLNSDMSYEYDLLHGWIKGITTGGGFEQRLARETDGTNPRFNGSIASMTWTMPGETALHKYSYVYDGMNRLTEARYAQTQTGLAPHPGGGGGLPGHLNGTGASLLSLIPSPESVGMSGEGASTQGFGGIGVWPGFPPQVNYADYSTEYSYDANSNITHLKRHGKNDFDMYAIIDDVSVEYYGNQKTNATDYEPNLTYSGASDFVDGNENSDRQISINDYDYNKNGALIRDLNRGISNIEYDLLGNEQKITFDSGNEISYVYSADGRRLRASHKTKIGNRTRTVSTDYCDNLILKNGSLSKYLFSGGYASFFADTISGLHYYVQDYMGNNRLVVDGRADTIEQKTHYYPYGGIIGDLSTNQNLQDFKFEGKELDRSFGLDWYDIHARQYDAIGVPGWNKPDPLAGDYTGFSPYAMCAGNPVNCVDKNGKWIETAWDVTNFIMDCSSAYSNFCNGNIGAGCIDVLAGLGDGLAAVVPIIPGGLGSLTKAVREADKVVDAVKSVENGIEVEKNVDRGANALKTASKDLKSNAPTANNGVSRSPHGGVEHNKAIDEAIKNLPQGADDIRKNQVQVNVDRIVVGKNRPDLQYNYNGKHYNVEFDKSKRQMRHHQQVVSRNDPNAINKFIYIEK